MVLTLDIFDFISLFTVHVHQFLYSRSFARSSDIPIEWEKKCGRREKKENRIHYALLCNGIKKKNHKQTNAATNVLEMNAGIILKLLNEKETVF